MIVQKWNKKSFFWKLTLDPFESTTIFLNGTELRKLWYSLDLDKSLEKDILSRQVHLHGDICFVWILTRLAVVSQLRMFVVFVQKRVIAWRCRWAIWANEKWLSICYCRRTSVSLCGITCTSSIKPTVFVFLYESSSDTGLHNLRFQTVLSLATRVTQLIHFAWS